MTQFARDAAKPAALVLGVVAGAALVWLMFGDKIKAALGAVGNAVNPTSDQNLAYKATNAVGAAITGRESFALGSWLYDKLNPDANLESDRRAQDIADERLERERQHSRIGGG